MAGAANPRWRARVELLVRLSAPALDLALAVGDRLSRLAHRGDPPPLPARAAHAGEATPRGLRSSS
jgi:hypothetical protein